MPDSASSPATLEPLKPESAPPNSQPDPVPLTHSASPSLSPAPLASNPNPNQALLSTPPPPPLRPAISYTPPSVSGGVTFVPPIAQSFRPLPPQAPQFSPLPVPGGAPNMNYQSPSVQPPGVSSASSMPMPMMSYQLPPGQPMRPYALPMPNGYATPPQGTMPPAVS